MLMALVSLISRSRPPICIHITTCGQFRYKDRELKRKARVPRYDTTHLIRRGSELADMISILSKYVIEANFIIR